MCLSTTVLILVAAALVGLIYHLAASVIMSQSVILMDEILDTEGELPGEWDYDVEGQPNLGLNPESLYELRYYMAVAHDDDIHVFNMHIAIKEETAERIAVTALQKRADHGSLPAAGGRRMHYMRRQREDGSLLIVILDCTSRYALIRLVITYLSGLLLTVVLLYAVIMGHFSVRLVQPFVENDERQKRFITNASHELKTPLAVISSNTEMMEALNGKTKWTDSTRRQVDRLKELIEDLVVLTRLDEMRDIPLSKIPLSDTTREMAESFRGVIENSGRRLTTDIPDGIIARAEERGFKQLTSILLDNASKYCDEGGEIRVSLSSRNRGRGARLKVANTYAEGRKEDYSRFFERFYREDASHNSTKAGFGIGLSMGREIAERLGGKLRADQAGDMIEFILDLG